MTECPKCEGFGSVCRECGLELEACDCGEDSKPWKCEECHGTGSIADQPDLFSHYKICTYPDCELDCLGRAIGEAA